MPATERPRGAATAVLDRQEQGVTAEAASTPVGSPRAEKLGPSPVDILLAGPRIPARERLGAYRRARGAGLSPIVSSLVAETSLATVRQPDSDIDLAAEALDERAAHPAIRDQVATIGTIGQIRDEGSPVYAEQRVREHVARRTVLLRVGEHHNKLNGTGPKGEARTAIERTAAGVAAEIVKEIDLTEGTPVDVRDAEMQAAMDAATIGVTMDLGNPYRRRVIPHVDFSQDIREIGSEGVARRTKALFNIPDSE